MQIKNKMEKFLLGLAGFFAVVSAVLGFKLEDNERMNQAIKDSIANAKSASSNAQEIISQNREQLLSKAAKSPAQEITQTVATETVVPGKVVKQVVPVTTTTKKTTKSS